MPYSIDHIEACPEVPLDEELSPQQDRLLRDHYGIDRADHELRTDNEDSYAARVEDGPGTPPPEGFEADADSG